MMKAAVVVLALLLSKGAFANLPWNPAHVQELEESSVSALHCFKSPFNAVIIHSHDSRHHKHNTGYWRSGESGKGQEGRQIFQVLQGEKDQEEGEKDQEQQQRPRVRARRR